MSRLLVMWALVAVYAIAAIGGVLTIGDRREPRTSGEAALGLVVCAAFIVALLYVGGVL